MDDGIKTRPSVKWNLREPALNTYTTRPKDSGLCEAWAGVYRWIEWSVIGSPHAPMMEGHLGSFNLVIPA